MDISKILSNLNEGDISKLKSMASSLFGDEEKAEDVALNENQDFKGEGDRENNENLDFKGEGDRENNKNQDFKGEGDRENKATILNILNNDAGDLAQAFARVGDMLNVQDDRCDFLLVLKPFLKEERQNKVDQAVKMLRLMSILPQLKEIGLLSGFF